MEVRHLQALVAINDHGTFSAAADHLGTVQSNVSAHVARLERELGAPLIDRSNGRLTEEGEAVVARARRILNELDALVSDVAACQDEVTGTVRIGMIGTTARWLVPQLLGRAAERHPNLQLVIVEGTTTGLEPQLAGGLLDLAVLNLPVPGKDLVSRLLFEEDLMLVVPADHPLAAEHRALTVPDLSGLRLILPVSGTAFRDELDVALRPSDIELAPIAQIDGLRLIASLVFEGFGPAILPATAIPSFLRGRFRPLAVAGLPRRRVGVAQRSRGLPSAPTLALLELLEAIVADPSDLPDGLHTGHGVPRRPSPGTST